VVPCFAGMQKDTKCDIVVTVDSITKQNWFTVYPNQNDQ
jgi:hypothetical protein